MTTFYQILPANTDGRDFVVGDLHGCLDLLEEQLDRQNFDTQRDRLFSVGDLIDRGPNSLGCLRLLRQPWFHAVVGNHEDMLLNYFSLRDSYSYKSTALLSNGGDWVTRLDSDEQEELREDLLPRVLSLPYVITVENGLETFHVAHAELLLNDDYLSESRLSRMVNELTWSRRLVYQVNLDALSERHTPFGALTISHKPWEPRMALRFVGHTPLSLLVMHRSHLFIDGGAFLRKDGAHLHVIEVANAHAWVEGL